MSLAIVYTFTAALFLALVFSLGLQSKTIARLNGVLLFIVGISGILFYGYGYSALFPVLLQAVMRTLFAVFGMFLGRSEVSAISSVPGLDTPFMQLIMYLTHLLALYCTASAVIAAIGKRLLRTIRLFLFRTRDLNVIYGVNDASINFAEQMRREHRGNTIFIGNDPGGKYESSIDRMGCLLFDDSEAKTPSAAFFRRIGMKSGSRHLSVYCLDLSPSANLRFSQNLNALLKETGCSPEQASLTAVLSMENAGAELLSQTNSSTDRSGAFGSVFAVVKPDMLSRMMIKVRAPYTTMKFDENGRALTDFEALVIGFGQTGQAVLRSLYANGQFEGSTFHASIVSAKFNKEAGSFFYRYPGMKAHECFTVLECNAQSVEFYTYLEKHTANLKYVAICTGNEAENAEIAYELREFLNRFGAHPVIMLIGKTGVQRLTEHKGLSPQTPFYSTDVLMSDRIDAMAKVINHQYHLNEGHTAEEDWKTCDYFSRLSCRASADYLDAFLKMGRTDRQTVIKNGWNLSGELLENLGKTEHLRWCAFHETMGFRRMPAEIYASRKAQYEKEKAETGRGKIRIGKDLDHRLHACLIPWDDLDELSSSENAITGKSIDYKEMDRDNVRMIPAMLQSLKTL